MKNRTTTMADGIDDLLNAQKRLEARRRRATGDRVQRIQERPVRTLRKAKGKRVRCTRCDKQFYATPSKQLRLRELPCPQVNDRGRTCGGRLRLTSWSGFLPAAEVLTPAE